MSRVLPFFIVFTVPAMLALGVELGGIWTIVPLLLTFVGVPLLDILLAENRDNPDEAEGHNKLFDLPILLWVPVELATTVFVLWRLSEGSYTTAEVLGLIVSLGVINGAGGINIAHELMHRKGKLHRACAEILMTNVTYTHFCVEHILGHHRHVATPEDAATSRFGETVYRFLPRTVFYSLTSAWRLEKGRCAKKKIAWWSLRDRRTRYSLVLVGVYAGVFLAFGPLGVLAFAAQGVIAFLLLEVINYIEHYGLARKKLASGRYERVLPKHSWNSPHLVSNWYLFNLARHSDHHYLASREYDRLRHHADAPQLPTGYAGMVILALFPPLWFRVMNDRVEAWNAKQGEVEASSATANAVAA